MESEKIVGMQFEDLTKEEMNFIAGGNENARISTAILSFATPYTSYIASGLGSAGLSAVSGLVSYTKKCI
jgi:type 2 lantibiotic (TIGR03893 family)